MTAQEWDRYRKIWNELAPQIRKIAGRQVEVHYGNCVRGIYQQGECPDLSATKKAQILGLIDAITFSTRSTARPAGYPTRVTFGPVMEEAWVGFERQSLTSLKKAAALYSSSSSSSTTDVPPWWPPSWPLPWPPYPTPPIPIPPMTPIAEDRWLLS